ncbi:MAG: WD40 repeat domain-containing protein, partial [Planctomycetota bacterium]
DGTILATADYLGVKLRDAATGEVRGEVRAEPSARSLAFSPDGKTLAIGGDHGSVVLWNLAAGRVRRREELPTEQRGHLVSLAFSPDGSVLAVGPQNALVYLMDPAGKRPSRVVEPGYWPLFKSQLSFAPDGASLLCVGSTAVVLDTATWEVRRELPTDPSGRANGIGAWSPDGRTIATATGDGPVRLWDAATGKAVGALDGHDGRVTRLAFSPDGKRLATGGSDTTVMVWEVPAR